MTDAAGTGSAAGDESARPQYGEYATPEEQRARIRRPDATEALSAGVSPDAAPQHPAQGRGSPKRGISDAAAIAAESRSAVRSGPLVDRVMTYVLLVLGALNVISLVPGLFVFDEQLQAVLALFDIDEPIAEPAAARLWGTIGAVVLLVGFAATAAFALWWMRRGRIAFWIPLVGALVTTVIFVICVNMVIADDPAFQRFSEVVVGFSFER